MANLIKSFDHNSVPVPDFIIINRDHLMPTTLGSWYSAGRVNT